MNKYGVADGHNVIKDYKNHQDYFSFAFVRNPWDKMLSFYSMHKREGWKLNFPWNSSNEPSFSEFIKIIYVKSPELQFDIFKGTGGIASHKHRLSNQIDWLTDETGKVVVDFIGRYENLQEDFSKVCDAIGIENSNLGHLNKSKHTHYSEYYDDESKKLVAEKFSKDIDYFNYKYEEKSDSIQ